jgi:hypothetical protein
MNTRRSCFSRLCLAAGIIAVDRAQERGYSIAHSG